ncbi:Heme/hemopexin utilization protein C precursor [Pigmentiphaga humi]|uniref:Heme/hemopexin utilization protein C n=1 Tax=Pigmentiphaga humi TaxID=2478468 RepID=A0A3P4AYK8_9BURK|nr:TonB-dependent receptor [Pigmentiphaga humi]VCU68651.1 Heme/hemopexin utilization protein C precursor [Pigmentiphaga humi]
MPRHIASTGRRTPEPFHLSVLVLSTLLAWAPAAWPQQAAGQQRPAPADAVRSYDLPAAPLAEALNRFAVETGILLSIDSLLADGKQAPALRGRYSVEGGLAALLAGSGLQAERDGQGGYALRRGGAVLAGEQAGGVAPGTLTLPSVPVIGEREAQRDAGTVDVVTRAELDRFAVTSTSDLFKGIPGVTAANARNGVSFDLNIRGMQSDRIKVLVDGTQATSNTSKSYGGENNHNYVDADLISSIVVEKGPNIGPNGAGTGGAVVNVSTLTSDDLIRDGKKWGLRLRGGWANHNSPGDGYMNYQGTAPLDVKTPDKNLSGSVAAAWRGLDDKLDLVFAHSQRRTSNYYAGERGSSTYAVTGATGETRYPLSLYGPGQQVFNTSQETHSTLFKARLELPGDQWAELSYNHLNSRFGESRLTAYDYNIEQKQPAEVRKSTWLARYGWRPASNPFWNLRANVWSVDLDELHPEVTYGVSGSTTTRGLEAWNTSELSVAGRELTLAYGGSVQTDKTTGLGITEPRGERKLYSLFARADAKLTERLSLEGGLRRETYTTDGTGSFVSSVPGQNRIPFSVEDGHSRLNPTVGVTFTPWRSTDLYARYSEGWRPPTAKEVGLTYGNAGSVLQPEVTRSIELGVRSTQRALWTTDDSLTVNLAWFNNRHKNYMARMLSTNSNTPYYYFNIDGARFRGAELSARYDNGRFFASYALTQYSKAQFCGFMEPQCTDSFTSDFGIAMFGVVLPPKRTQTLVLGGRFFERRLTLGVRAHFVSGAAGRLQDSQGNTMNLGWQPYEVFDLFGSYRVNRYLDVNFSIENLRDRYYIEALSTPALAIPAPGRTAKVTVTYQF